MMRHPKMREGETKNYERLCYNDFSFQLVTEIQSSHLTLVPIFDRLL